MSSIDIRHDHSKTPEQARTAVEQAARKLGERFDMQSHWEGDRLRFSRSGVEGAIELLPSQVRVTAQLGFLLSAMQSMVETEIRRVLSEKLN
jgi:putative polyhydroxyalkanoate system protein